MCKFITIGREGMIPEGKAMAVTVGDRLIAVFHHQGTYHAITDVCPHMGASLAEGVVDQGVVTCPWHAWRFRLCDGTWCDNPTIKIESYPVRVVQGEIQVCIDPQDEAP